jgi:hypothetical protein
MNPAQRFITPEAVLSDPETNNKQKLEVLRQWENDEREISIAINEGMPGPEPVFLSRIAIAISKPAEAPDAISALTE